MTASRRLYSLLLAIAAVIAFSFFYPAAATLGWILNLILASVLILDYYLTPSSKYFTAVRTAGDRLSIGRKNEVRIEIYNQSKAYSHCWVRDAYPLQLEADVKEFVFSLAAGTKAVLEYTLLPSNRGEYEFGDIAMRYGSRLGLFWRQVKIPATCSVKVYPDLKALKELSIKLAHSSALGELNRRRRGQGTDFACLREYVNGDDIRSMDWKATARKDRPVLRVYEVEQEQTLMVLVDAGRMMTSDLEGLSRFDHALNAALSLVLAGLCRNDQVGLGIFADKPLLYMPPRRGKAYMTRVMEACAGVRARMVEPDYTGALTFFATAHKARSLMVVLTDMSDPSGSQALLSGLASLSPRHLPFCVTLRDRQVDDIASSRSLELDGVLKKAVATDLIAQRDLAFSHLARRGCLVLDCAPQDLSGKLVEKYLDIKARGLL